MMSRESLNALLKASFPFFLKRVFLHLNPAEELKDNWHLDAMCHCLSEVHRGRTALGLVRDNSRPSGTERRSFPRLA